MNQLVTNLGTLLSNPHLRYPAIAIGLLEAAKQAWPQYAPQIEPFSKIGVLFLAAASANAPTPPPTPVTLKDVNTIIKP